MKWIFLLSLLFLMACNEAPETPTADSAVYDPKPVTPDEVQRLNLICNALIYKNESIGVLVDSSYAFSYSRKSCSSDTFAASSDVPVVIRRDGPQYSFFKTDGQPFVFSNIEMINSGVMKEICTGLAAGNLETPMEIDGVMTWFTTYVQPGECSSDAEHMCIHFKRGVSAGGQTYERHTEEWVQFKIRGQRAGFFTARKILSQGDCEKGQTAGRHATLK